MKAMRKQYGKNEGESVFYASKNKGTIKGVDEDMDINEGEVKRRNKKLKKDAMPKRKEDYYEAGAHSSPDKDFGGDERGQKKKRGKKTHVKGLLGRTYKESGPRTRKDRAKSMLKRYTFGPKQKLPDHTVYHDIGYLMAESLGLVSEARDLDRARDAGADKSAPSPKKKADRYDSKKELRGELAAKARRQGKTADDVIMSEPAKPRTPEQEAARKKFQAKQKKSVATAKLKHRARTTGEPQKVIKRKKK